ncbi:MAG: hypothetical protein IJ849_07350 [Selenomonadaceae bacterium]|nr:hypothetical protein [Selenomonadaceae bacterium]
MRFIIGFLLAWSLLISPVAFAAEEVDFSCRGLYLGDSAEKMEEIWGRSLYDKEVSVLGIAVTYYYFGNGYEIGVARRTGQVVDIKIEDKKYKGRDNIKYGATFHKIQKTYGQQKKEMLDGEIFYIYPRPGNAKDRLLVKVDTEKGALLSWRITSLPLTPEEADEMVADEWEEEWTEDEEITWHFDDTYGHRPADNGVSGRQR